MWGDLLDVLASGPGLSDSLLMLHFDHHLNQLCEGFGLHFFHGPGSMNFYCTWADAQF